MTDTETMRTKVLDAIADLFREMNEAEPVGDPYGVTWSIVTRDPIGALSKGKSNALGVYGGGTSRSAKHPFLEITLPCVVEVHVAKQVGVDMSKAVERLLGVVERCIRANTSLGGLTYDLRVTGDQVTVDGPYDNQAEGALFFDVRYSQREDDPRIGR